MRRQIKYICVYEYEKLKLERLMLKSTLDLPLKNHHLEGSCRTHFSVFIEHWENTQGCHYTGPLS